MNWNDAILQVIDLRTFSNIWYWLAVAVSWSTVSHWIIGVPFDMIFRARRNGGDALSDLETLVAINVRRLMTITALGGMWITGFISFVLTSLAAMGFYYGFELAQGFFCLVFPMSLVGVMTMRITRRYSVQQPAGETLARELLQLRFWIQVIAMISIFFTAMYGMYHNLSVTPGF
ncbi:hypothetical protein [Yoonia sp.]|uniref:hypothetical protein n=1 Tax=Yoonia sp. TaxID=2212373 RepID=UPI0025DEC2A6|nr:hypothetical protein [Yoonia sp.]